MKAAQAALRVWYTHGHNRANAIIPQMQIDSNLKEVAALPGWQAQEGARNGYVMLTTLVNGRLRPTILVLDIEHSPSGRLSGCGGFGSPIGWSDTTILRIHKKLSRRWYKYQGPFYEY